MFLQSAFSSWLGVFEFEKTGIRLQELVKKSLMLVLWPLSSMNLSSPVAETHRERPPHHTAQHRQERKLLIGYTKHSCVLLFSEKKKNLFARSADCSNTEATPETNTKQKNVS